MILLVMVVNIPVLVIRIVVVTPLIIIPPSLVVVVVVVVIVVIVVIGVVVVVAVMVIVISKEVTFPCIGYGSPKTYLSNNFSVVGTMAGHSIANS
ncbi:hypothetical protein Tco_0920839 [Tanacetum coccineum]